MCQQTGENRAREEGFTRRRCRCRSGWCLWGSPCPWRSPATGARKPAPLPSEVPSRVKPKPRHILASCGKPYRTRGGNKKTVRISTQLATQLYPKSWVKSRRGLGWIRDSTSCHRDYSELQVSTRILGRRTAPFPTFPYSSPRPAWLLPKILVLTAASPRRRRRG